MMAWKLRRYGSVRRNRRAALYAITMLSLTLAPVWAQKNAAQTFHVDVNTIQVPLTVLDGSGHVITDVRREDFRLLENGLPQDIRSLTLDTQDIRVVLLLDLSRSLKSQLRNIKHAAIGFVEALGPRDKVAVISFAHDVELAQGWTSDKRKLRRAIERLQAGTTTELYDAVYLAVEDYLSDISEKKAIVLITDGVDAVSDTGFEQLQRSILKRQAAIYIINLLKSVKGDMARYRRVAFVARALDRLGEPDALEKFFQSKEEEMNVLAQCTGGRAIYPQGIESLQTVYAQVARELKSQFLLTYVPANPEAKDGYRVISLLHRRPEFQLLYRRGYYNN